MQVVRDPLSIAELRDPEVRGLIQQRVDALLRDFGDYELHELVTFVVVEPDDSLGAIDEQLGFSILSSPFELCEEHAGFYEMVFVLSDDGYGIEVFISKAVGVDPRLLAMCATHLEVDQ